MEINKLNGVQPANAAPVKKESAEEAPRKEVPAEPKEKAPVGAVGYPGASQVVRPISLNAGEAWEGNAIPVKCLGEGAITVEEVTPENVEKYSKYIDIWYQGTKEDALAAEKDLRFLHPRVGESFQHYGLMPMSDPYVTHDPETIAYVRENGLTRMNDKGEECFLNCYNGDKSFIEETYTDENGNFLSEVGGLKGAMKATQSKDTLTVLLPVGSKVKPLNDENPRTVGVGDIVSCAVKKGKPKNDWFVKPATEFLKTAKKTPESAEFITAIETWVANGSDPKEWKALVEKYS